MDNLINFIKAIINKNYNISNKKQLKVCIVVYIQFFNQKTT